MKTFFAPLFVMLALPSSAHAEDIISIMKRKSQMARPVPPAINPYNYTVDITMAGQEGDDISPPFTAKLRINPAAPAQERATIISTSSADYSDDFKEMLEEIRDPETDSVKFSEDFWCEGMEDDEAISADDFSEDDFTVISETETEAVIRPNLQRMAELMMDSEADEDMSKSERKMMKKMMERLDGEFILSKPAGNLKQFKIWLTRPMTVKVVAKIKEMEVQQSCALAPNGFSYTEAVSMNVRLKALGMNVLQDMDIKVSELTLR